MINNLSFVRWWKIVWGVWRLGFSGEGEGGCELISFLVFLIFDIFSSSYLHNVISKFVTNYFELSDKKFSIWHSSYIEIGYQLVI